MISKAVIGLFRELIRYPREIGFLAIGLAGSIFGGLLLPLMYCAMGYLSDDTQGSNNSSEIFIFVAAISILGLCTVLTILFLVKYKILLLLSDDNKIGCLVTGCRLDERWRDDQSILSRKSNRCYRNFLP